MYSSGVLLLLTFAPVILCQNNGQAGRGGKSKGSDSDGEMNTIGEVYTVTSDILLGGNVIYLPLESEFSGVIYQAEMKLLTKDPVYLQVWRPTTTENMYKFISEVEIEAEETGMTMNFSLAASKNGPVKCPVIHTDDRVGIFTLSEKTPVATIYHSTETLIAHANTSISSATTEIQFSTQQIARTFSIKLYIAAGTAGSSRSSQKYMNCPIGVDVPAAKTTKASSVTTSGLRQTATDQITPPPYGSMPRQPVDGPPSVSANVSPNAPVQDQTLIISVSIVAAAIVIAAGVAGILLVRHKRNEHKAGHDSEINIISGSAEDLRKAPTNPNPAYGIHLDFGNQYETISSRISPRRPSLHDYRPVVPPRPTTKGEGREIGTYEELRDGSWQKANDSELKKRLTAADSNQSTSTKDSQISAEDDSKTVPSNQQGDPTYLDLLPDETDSGVGGSRPSSGVNESHT